MVADLREMQENQGFSENRKDKLEFIEMLFQSQSFLCQSDRLFNSSAFVSIDHIKS